MSKGFSPEQLAKAGYPVYRRHASPQFFSDQSVLKNARIIERGEPFTKEPQRNTSTGARRPTSNTVGGGTALSTSRRTSRKAPSTLGAREGVNRRTLIGE